MLAARRDADVIIQHVSAHFDYPVHFTRDLFAADNPVLRCTLARREPHRGQRVLAVVDAHVAAAWPLLPSRIAEYAAASPGVDLVAPPLVVPGGERIKNDEAACGSLLTAMDAAGIDRQSHILAIGGGALLDAVGFAASLLHRGVRVTRVPTTLLAQCDGGVGVETAVNAFGRKDVLGTFAPPFAVCNDLRWLETLPIRELRAGMAPAVKVALVRDAAFFEWLWTHVLTLARFDTVSLDRLIRESARLHLAELAGSGDLFRAGAARRLEFGHWAAYRLEAVSDGAVHHGEAVALGIALDCTYATLAGSLAWEECDRILTLAERLGLPTWHDALAAWADDRLGVLDGLEEFRTRLGGELAVTMLHGIGRAHEVRSMDPTRVRRAIEVLRTRRFGR